MTHHELGRLEGRAEVAADAIWFAIPGKERQSNEKNFRLVNGLSRDGCRAIFFMEHLLDCHKEQREPLPETVQAIELLIAKYARKDQSQPQEKAT